MCLSPDGPGDPLALAETADVLGLHGEAGVAGTVDLADAGLAVAVTVDVDWNVDVGPTVGVSAGVGAADAAGEAEATTCALCGMLVGGDDHVEPAPQAQSSGTRANPTASRVAVPSEGTAVARPRPFVKVSMTISPDG